MFLGLGQRGVFHSLGMETGEGTQARYGWAFRGAFGVVKSVLSLQDEYGGKGARVHSPENRSMNLCQISDGVVSKRSPAAAVVTCQSPRAISRSSWPAPQPA